MKTIFTILIIFSLSFTTQAQTPSESGRIQATVTRFLDALAQLDDNAIKAEVTKDFTLVEHGLIWNTDTLLNLIKPRKGQDIKRINTLVFTKTEQSGNTAWTVYYNTANFHTGDKIRTVKWLESAVLVKEKNAWKLKLLHSTDLK
jgi:uncharacterized protein DUF4440